MQGGFILTNSPSHDPHKSPPPPVRTPCPALPRTSHPPTHQPPPLSPSTKPPAPPTHAHRPPSPRLTKPPASPPLSQVEHALPSLPPPAQVDQASIDVLLVGDSAAMVVHGHDTTLPITLEEMLVHCRAVARGAKHAFLVGDMPFGSYETGPRDAVMSATRFLKEGSMDAVKLEGA